MNTQLSVRNCTLKSNSAAQGGGLFVSGATSQVTVNNCTLTGNLAKDAFEAGGGIFLRDGATVIVANSIFEGNSAVAANGRGGAVFVCGGMITLTNVVLVGNGNSQFGNGSYAIAVNTGGLTGCTAGTALVSNGVLFDNVPAAVTGSGVDISYSQIDGGFSGAGNFSGNPLFSDAQYHLLEGISPCVDAGDPAAVHDDACLPPSLATARNDVGAYGGPGACAW